MEKILLPIGSIVELKGGKGKLMITGYGMQNNSDKKYYDYSSALFPMGFNPQEINLFNDEDIREVYHIGYQEPKAVKYRTEMTKFVKDIKGGMSVDEAAKKLNERLGIK